MNRRPAIAATVILLAVAAGTLPAWSGGGELHPSPWRKLVRRIVEPLWTMIADADSARADSTRSAVADEGLIDASRAAWEAGRIRGRWTLSDSCVGKRVRLVRLGAQGDSAIVDQDVVDTLKTVVLEDTTAPAHTTVHYQLEVLFDQGVVRRTTPERVEVPDRLLSRFVHRVWARQATTGIEVGFELQRAAAVQLEVFDLAGRRLADVPPAWMGTGRHRIVHVPTPGLAPGIYFCRLRAGAERYGLRLSISRDPRH